MNILPIVPILAIVLIAGCTTPAPADTGTPPADDHGHDHAGDHAHDDGTGDSGDTAGDDPSDTGTANIVELSVEAVQWEFIPADITVQKGQTVHLTLESTDVPHSFALSEYGINEVLLPDQPVTIEFVADQEGVFTSFCAVPCGAGHSAMKGTFTVEV